MDIILYKNASDNNVIGKNLTQLGSAIPCVAKGDVSIYAPTIILNYADYTDANYAYIDDFERYYFITDKPVKTGGRIELSLKSDPLETFKSQILNLNAVIEKQENKGNMYFNDGSFNVTAREFLTTYNFPSGFSDDGEFILITCGG